jgi:hypothetical protein
MKYDIHNPTQARRVIYDGIKGSMKQITIEAGETKLGCEVHEDIAKEMAERTKNDGERKTDLLFRPASGKVDGKHDEDTRTPARVKADELVAKADEMEFVQFKSEARDVLGDSWPGGNPSKEAIVELLQKVK